MEDRRTFLGLAGAGALAVGMAAGAVGTGSAAAQQNADPAGEEAGGLKAAFLEVFAGSFDYGKIRNFIADNAVIVSHDVPFPLDKAGYVDHMAFHADLWEKRELIPEAVEAVVHGKGEQATGIVSCYFNERGKPKNAGFRQRPGYMTVTCAKTGNGWLAVGLHTSSLRAQIVNASPG